MTRHSLASLEGCNIRIGKVMLVISNMLPIVVVVVTVMKTPLPVTFNTAPDKMPTQPQHLVPHRQQPPPPS